MPESLLDHENVLKMVTILFPCTTKGILPDYCKAKREQLVQTFRENSQKSRTFIFSEPLVKYLWSNVFIKNAPEIVVDHLRWIHSQPCHGAVKFDRVFKDMKQLEITCNFKMLPDSARSPDGTKVFSKKEQFEYLLENGKHNKR